MKTVKKLVDDFLSTCHKYFLIVNYDRKVHVMAQPAARQEGAQAQGEAQPLVPQAPKPPIVYRRRIRTRR
jgi:hypothetical protein